MESEFKKDTGTLLAEVVGGTDVAIVNQLLDWFLCSALPELDGKGDECIGCGQVLEGQVIFRANPDRLCSWKE